MNKKKEKFWILLSSLLLAVAALTLVLLLSDEDMGMLEKVSGGILSTLWAFGCIPSYVFCYRWMNRQDFATGFSYGYVFKFFGLFVPLLLSPIGLIFYLIKDE